MTLNRDMESRKMHLMAPARADTHPSQEDSHEAGILAGLVRRENAALNQLVERYSRALARAAYLFIGDSDAAQDAVQDTFITAWDSAKKIRGGSALKPWLYGVLYNKCRKRLRKKRLIKRWEEGAIERRHRDESSGEDPRIESTRQALAKLSPDFRVLIVLRYERGLSVTQTAQALGVPEGTIKSRTHNAIKELRRIMGVNHDEQSS